MAVARSRQAIRVGSLPAPVAATFTGWRNAVRAAVRGNVPMCEAHPASALTIIVCTACDREREDHGDVRCVKGRFVWLYRGCDTCAAALKRQTEADREREALGRVETDRWRADKAKQGRAHVEILGDFMTAAVCAAGPDGVALVLRRFLPDMFAGTRALDRAFIACGDVLDLADPDSQVAQSALLRARVLQRQKRAYQLAARAVRLLAAVECDHRMATEILRQAADALAGEPEDRSKL